MKAERQIIKGVIFDLDGTLGDTVQISLEGFRRAFFKYSGDTYTDEEILATWGPSEEGVFMNVFPDQWQDALAEYLRVYDQLHTEWGIGAFEGMADLLDGLEQARVKQAVVTAKGPHSAEISLKHFGMLDRFEYIETGSPQRFNKVDRIKFVLEEWELPKENVLYVGDLPSDIKASRQAGIVPVGAAWASTADPHELASHDPEFLFGSVASFHSWLCEQLNNVQK